MQSQMVRIGEAAEILGVHPESVLRIPGVRVYRPNPNGGHRRFDAAELEALREARTAKYEP